MSLRYSWLGLCLMASTAVSAQTLEMPASAAAGDLDEATLILPSKGVSMSEVERQLGPPLGKVSTGGDSPKQPPITRWDYEGFVVVFERDRVIDAVVQNAPTTVFNQDELQTAP